MSRFGHERTDRLPWQRWFKRLEIGRYGHGRQRRCKGQLSNIGFTGRFRGAVTPFPEALARVALSLHHDLALCPVALWEPYLLEPVAGRAWGVNTKARHRGSGVFEWARRGIRRR